MQVVFSSIYCACVLGLWLQFMGCQSGGLHWSEWCWDYWALLKSLPSPWLSLAAWFALCGLCSFPQSRSIPGGGPVRLPMPWSGFVCSRSYEAPWDLTMLELLCEHNSFYSSKSHLSTKNKHLSIRPKALKTLCKIENVLRISIIPSKASSNNLSTILWGVADMWELYWSWNAGPSYCLTCGQLCEARRGCRQGHVALK